MCPINPTILYFIKSYLDGFIFLIIILFPYICQIPFFSGQSTAIVLFFSIEIQNIKDSC